MSRPTIKLYDLASNLLAELSGIAFEPSFTREHNHARQFQLTCPAGHSLLAGGNLRRGSRKLVVWEEGETDPLFHGRVFGVERNGDGKQNLVTITAYDPRMEFGYESDDRAGRPVRDATGNLVTPTFTSSVGGQEEISGPDLILQVLRNSQGNVDTIGDPNLHEGPLPIATLDESLFDLDVPPALDLRFVNAAMDWPVMVGDFIDRLVDSNVVDIDLIPINPVAGSYAMVEVTARSLLGTDRSGTVHFDYWTGSRNAKACRHVEDFSTICNKLYDFLGPRSMDNEHWKGGNITPGSPGTLVDPTASRALYGGPGADKGEFMWIRSFDTLGADEDRPLYIVLWNAEQGLRVEPRDLLYITPDPDAKALFDAPKDFDTGDLVTIDTGADFGIELADAQRVYGYVKTWSREGVAQLSQLRTSADV